MKIQINPISVNKCFQGRRFKTPAYKAWREEFCLKAKTDCVDFEAKEVIITFGIKNFKMADLDNLIKPLLDALQEAHIIKDDRYIEKIHANKVKVDKKEDEYIEITLL